MLIQRGKRLLLLGVADMIIGVVVLVRWCVLDAMCGWCDGSICRCMRHDGVCSSTGPNLLIRFRFRFGFRFSSCCPLDMRVCSRRFRQHWTMRSRPSFRTRGTARYTPMLRLTELKLSLLIKRSTNLTCISTFGAFEPQTGIDKDFVYSWKNYTSISSCSLHLVHTSGSTPHFVQTTLFLTITTTRTRNKTKPSSLFLERFINTHHNPCTNTATTAGCMVINTSIALHPDPNTLCTIWREEIHHYIAHVCCTVVRLP